MIRFLTYLFFACIAFLGCVNPLFAQRPRIGLTLSGGGAKGLAHIGILKAIDSAGLKIDYVTGTSMGSVIGSLYAIGYSADSIDKMARQIDWDLLLSNQSSVRSLFMEEKEEYNKYDIEIPWINNNFRIATGFLEAQELWLKLSEFYFPVTNTKDFSKFSIPFKCIATDVGNGEAVVLSKGEIVSAIRASLAIPSVFTAVEYDGKKLVDGGISRNFPVKDAKDMGADYMIGSTVAGGLLPPDKVRNVIQLLLQIAFFREAEDAKKEIPLCDIYIPFQLEEFNMASFADSRKLLQLGIEEGRKYYPQFKALADSLNKKYGEATWPVKRLPVNPGVRIRSYQVNGLQNTTSSFFINTMNFQVNKTYTAKELANRIRQAFGTRYYNRITYSLMPLDNNEYHIIFDVNENPLTYLKASIHYNQFSGIGLIANVTSRNLILKNSRSMASINIGETFRVKGEHLQYIGRLKNFGFTLKTQFDRFNLPTYEIGNTKEDGFYRHHIYEFSDKLHYSPSRFLSFGVGHRFEWIKNSSRIASEFEIGGSNNITSLFGFIKQNTLDRSIFPKRGLKIDWEFARIVRQRVHSYVLNDGHEPMDPDSAFIDNSSYWRSTLSVEGYLPVTPSITALGHIQAGANINYGRNVLNDFIVGGMTKQFRNQITFAGLQEGSVYSPALATLQAGLRAQLFTGAYLTGKANVLFNNMVSKHGFVNYRDFYSGYAITFSYNFALGPLDLSVMYCDQTRRVQTYVNLGIPF